jgi:hypothetical protein
VQEAFVEVTTFYFEDMLYIVVCSFVCILLPFYRLSFDLRILVAPFLSSNVSFIFVDMEKTRCSLTSEVVALILRMFT